MSTYTNPGEVECDCYIANILPDCLSTLIIPQLETDMEYTAHVTDHFGNKQTVPLDPMTVGALNVDGLAHPFNAYQEYKLEVYSSAGAQIQFTFGGLIYNCILLRFQTTSPIQTEAKIT